MNRIKVIRYPGSKYRFLDFLLPYLPDRKELSGNFVEPFVGGGAVFFAINPYKAILSDINSILIDLYRGLKRDPLKVWQIYKQFPATKAAYYKIRNTEEKRDLYYKAAKTLFLNRTCFKGMWRQNSSGQFNVGYGGQDRRWVINENSLVEVSRVLRKAKLRACDFEATISECKTGDFLFLDPPYKPGLKDLNLFHYVFEKFTFEDHKRLANVLKAATRRNVRWAMTTTSHHDILSLFKKNRIIPFVKGTGTMPGIIDNKTGEVLICNY